MSTGGFTLAEVLVVSTITSLVVGGTLAASVTAARMQRVQNGPALAEASGYAQELLESFRNRVGKDDTFFPTAATAHLWTTSSLPASGGSESILSQSPKRCYRVTSACSGGCYELEVAVCWSNLTGCPCP